LDIKATIEQSYPIVNTNLQLIGYYIDEAYKVTTTFDFIGVFQSTVRQIEQDINLIKRLKLIDGNITEIINKKRFSIEEMIDIRDVHEYLTRINELVDRVGIDATHDHFIKLILALTSGYGILLESFIFILKHIVEAVVLSALIFGDYNVRVILTYYFLLWVYSTIAEYVLAFIYSAL